MPTRGQHSAGQAMARISLLLASCMCVLPFLLPYHQLPIKSFQAEWLAVAMGMAAVFVLSFARAPGIAVPASARWLIAFALLLLAHAIFGMPAYRQLPLTGAVYVLYAVLMIFCGERLAALHGQDRTLTWLTVALLAGALLTGAAGIVQFYGRPAWLESAVAELHGTRAYGNIAQFNLYALYLAWGLASLLFLWVRGHVSANSMLTGTALLNMAVVLSSSRAWLLYLGWIALLLYLSGRNLEKVKAQQRNKAILAILAITAIIQVGAPWINSHLGLGPSNQGGLSRALSPDEYSTDGRWQAWLMAWRIFVANFPFGTGLGEFAGAAFQAGLPQLMAYQGTVWTSPHNILLQLLAESGIAGTILVVGALGSWWWKAIQTYMHTRGTGMVWIMTTVGVVTIQSLIEYPLWNAHFLGVTALLMGMAATANPTAKPDSVLARTMAGGVCLAIAMTLAIILRDYVRLDSVLITGTMQTLSSSEQKDHDKAVIKQVAQGPLMPVAELWMMRGMEVDRTDLANKLAMSERVIRYWPENNVVTRRAALLALDGKTADAEQLLSLALKTFPQGCSETKAILARIAIADSEAIGPLRRMVDNLVPDCG
jgi:O-antigen ligase